MASTGLAGVVCVIVSIPAPNSTIRLKAPLYGRRGKSSGNGSRPQPQLTGAKDQWRSRALHGCYFTSKNKSGGPVNSAQISLPDKRENRPNCSVANLHAGANEWQS